MPKVAILPTISEAELRDALAKVRWSIPNAAALLGVHRATIYRLMRRYGLSRPS